MATQQSKPSAISMALDFLPMVIYILAYRFFKTHDLELLGQSYNGIVAATIISIPALFVFMGISYTITREVTPMQIFTAVILVFFGGLTIYFNDGNFTKMRPSLVYGSMGLALAYGVYARGTSYFQWLMGKYMPFSNEDWLKFTKAYVLFMIVMVVINELVRRYMSDDAWVWLDTIGQGALGLVFMLTQFKLILKTANESDGQ